MTDEAQIEAVRRLLRLAERYRLAELEVEEGGVRVTIRGAGRTAGLAPALAAAPAAPDLTESGADETEPGSTATADLPHAGRLHPLLSPMTGTFYRSEAPELPLLVEVGQVVEEGQTIGLIEAMKVFSAVPADRAGRVVEFRVRNGQLLQEGEPILLMEPPG